MTVTQADVVVWRAFTQDQSAFIPTEQFAEWATLYSEQTVRTVLETLTDEGYCFGNEPDWDKRLARAFWKWNQKEKAAPKEDGEKQILRSMDRFVGAQNVEDTKAMVAELRRRKFSDEEILEAIDAHRNDITRNQSGQPNGKFRPGYSEVLAKIQEKKELIFPQERAMSYSAQREEDRQAEGDAHYRTVELDPVADAKVIGWMGTNKLRCRKAFCADCQDTGWVRFFYDPKNPKRIWLKDEYLALPDEEGLALSISTATCSCVRGVGGQLPSGHEITGRRQEMAGAVHPFHGGGKPTLPQIELLARRRGTLERVEASNG